MVQTKPLGKNMKPKPYVMKFGEIYVEPGDPCAQPEPRGKKQ